MTLQEAEEIFLIKKLGVKKPLDEMRKQFYRVNGGVGSFLTELEKSWLKSSITTAGGTPIGNYKSALWQQLNAVSGFRVSHFEDENKFTYFINTA